MDQAQPSPACPCVECGGTTHPIKVLSYSHLNAHAPLEYAATDAKAGSFTGRYRVKGHLAAEMCDGCGRVTFRASPFQALPADK